MAQTATRYRNPSWWTGEHDSAWDRVKEAFRRDWEQTKHDFGAGGKDLDQDVHETVGQAVGAQPIPPGNQPNYEEDEAAARFGYGARRQYGSSYSQWNDDLEARLKKDWETVRGDTGASWDRARRAVRRGWDYTG
jgi:hypothetical protein